jgi:hypothetical protein
MKNILHFSLLILLTLCLMSCTPQQASSQPTDTSSDYQIALHTLVEFLQNLHDGSYEDAVQFYGGTYETLVYFNPTIPPNDHAALLRNACTINGIHCLQVNSAGLDRQVSDTEFVFKVDFLNPDGTLFVLGPCCGASETESPPQSVFMFTVRKEEEGKFLVLDLPPYTP